MTNQLAVRAGMTESNARMTFAMELEFACIPTRRPARHVVIHPIPSARTRTPVMEKAIVLAIMPWQKHPVPMVCFAMEPKSVVWMGFANPVNRRAVWKRFAMKIPIVVT
jgi:hypothetical protein